MNNQAALRTAKKLRDLSTAWYMKNYGAELMEAACTIENLVEDKIRVEAWARNVNGITTNG